MPARLNFGEKEEREPTWKKSDQDKREGRKKNCLLRLQLFIRVNKRAAWMLQEFRNSFVALLPPPPSLGVAVQDGDEDEKAEEQEEEEVEEEVKRKDRGGRNARRGCI